MSFPSQTILPMTASLLQKVDHKINLYITGYLFSKPNPPLQKGPGGGGRCLILNFKFLYIYFYFLFHFYTIFQYIWTLHN